MHVYRRLPVSHRLQSEVVATTLSSAGGELLQLMPRAASAGSGGIGSGASASGAPLLGFDAIICDEAAQVGVCACDGAALPAHRAGAALLTWEGSQTAASLSALRVQALEPSTLIALQLLAPGGRLVLVGDPQQLPATVVSRAAAAAALAQSLFERLQQAGYPLCLLRQQYRMHPAISAWPSSFFYSGQLQDAAAVVVPPSGGGGGGGGGGRSAPWHERPCFPPLAFWDCREASAGAGRLGVHACGHTRRPITGGPIRQAADS